MRRFLCVSLVVLIGITTAACGPGKLFGPTFTPTPTITLTPTSTPTLTPTLKPSPTPTPIGGSGQLLVDGYRCDSPNSCTPGIYRYNISTHQTTLLFENYGLEGISPDGSKLLVSQVVGGADIYNLVGKLYITNLDGSNPVLLSTNFSHGGNLNAYWFSDSDSIVFRANSGPIIQLYVRQPDGAVEQITKSIYGVGDFLTTLSDGGIFWKEGSRNYDYGWRWTKMDGTGTKKLQNWDRLAISPNGEYIAYIYYNPSPPWTKDYDISRTDGSSTVKIDVSSMVENPSPEIPLSVDKMFWLPDSQRILVQVPLCNPVCDTFSHFVLSASGEVLGKISKEEFNFDFTVGSWSPDGRQFGFLTIVRTGNSIVMAPKVLDIETMKIQDIDSNIPNVTNFNSVYWLP